MRLQVKNIAGITDADIRIDGITVIAGENNTGKSTVGKVLYCIFNSFYQPKEHIRRDRESSISSILRRYFMSFSSGYPSRIMDGFVDPDTDKRKLLEDLRRYLDEMERTSASDIDEIPFPSPDEVDIDDIAETIQSVALVSDDEVMRKFMTKSFGAEFNGQINSVNNSRPGKVTLTIAGSDSTCVIEDNRVVSVSQVFNLGTKIAYIDDPFVLDEVSTRRGLYGHWTRDHRFDLERKLEQPSGQPTIFDELILDEKMERIYQVVDQVCAGHVVRKGRQRGFSYRDPNLEEPIDVRNLSSGLKTFVIVKELLGNGTLAQNGSVILDEPEIHLHPEWQLIFARLIVLLQKEFGMHILLNTHSPYFLRAVEVYCSLYEVADKAHYYLAGHDGVVGDVSDSTEEIYRLLAKPLDDLEEVAYGIL